MEGWKKGLYRKKWDTEGKKKRIKEGTRPKTSSNSSRKSKGCFRGHGKLFITVTLAFGTILAL